MIPSSALRRITGFEIQGANSITLDLSDFCLFFESAELRITYPESWFLAVYFSSQRSCGSPIRNPGSWLHSRLIPSRPIKSEI